MPLSLLFRTIARDKKPVSTRKENRDMDKKFVVGIDVAKDNLIRYVFFNQKIWGQANNIPM